MEIPPYPPEEKIETGWLIEFTSPSGIIWWAGNTVWTADAYKAVRFARKVDAETVIACDMRLYGCTALEHQWG